jgi:hypothetical protein
MVSLDPRLLLPGASNWLQAFRRAFYLTCGIEAKDLAAVKISSTSASLASKRVGKGFRHERKR